MVMELSRAVPRMTHRNAWLRAPTFERILKLPSLCFADVRQMPDAPGIYCIVVDGAHLVYVGCTSTTLRERWANHHQVYAASTLGENPRVYFHVMDADLTWAAESIIIRTFHPILNGRPLFQVGVEISPSGKRFVHLSFDEGTRRVREHTSRKPRYVPA